MREVRIPVPAAAARSPQRFNLTDLMGGGSSGSTPLHLRLTLVAENRDATSGEPARLDDAVVLQDGPGQLEVVRLEEAAATLKWRGLPGGLATTTYTVSCFSDNPLDPPRAHATPFTSVTWSGLAPNTSYTFAVWANTQVAGGGGSGRTAAATVRVKTQGPSLPAPRLTVADLVPGSATSVKLSWSLPVPEHPFAAAGNLSYGVWFGRSEEELLGGGPRRLVDLAANTWTERNLTACTSYVFAVAVLLKGAGGPDDSAGLIGAAGPRSNYRLVTTKFSPVRKSLTVDVWIQDRRCCLVLCIRYPTDQVA